MTLRTLAEDVKLFSTDISNKRLKDLSQALNTELPGLFSFFYKFLENKFTLYIQEQVKSTERAKRNLKLVETVLQTLLVYVEWVPLRYLITIHI
jgi:hypothetical protein